MFNCIAIFFIDIVHRHRAKRSGLRALSSTQPPHVCACGMVSSLLTRLWRLERRALCVSGCRLCTMHRARITCTRREHETRTRVRGYRESCCVACRLSRCDSRASQCQLYTVSREWRLTISVQPRLWEPQSRARRAAMPGNFLFC